MIHSEHRARLILIHIVLLHGRPRAPKLCVAVLVCHHQQLAFRALLDRRQVGRDEDARDNALAVHHELEVVARVDAHVAVWRVREQLGQPDEVHVAVRRPRQHVLHDLDEGGAVVGAGELHLVELAAQALLVLRLPPLVLGGALAEGLAEVADQGQAAARDARLGEEGEPEGVDAQDVAVAAKQTQGRPVVLRAVEHAGDADMRSRDLDREHAHDVAVVVVVDERRGQVRHDHDLLCNRQRATLQVVRVDGVAAHEVDVAAEQQRPGECQEVLEVFEGVHADDHHDHIGALLVEGADAAVVVQVVHLREEVPDHGC
mmetsp:Transcript_73801/g.193588  ORF Transcript_73801/g.193588 Transcript_73801/m.193588 type:complete len:316 (+) Transcript_73801:1268-2215(+)